MVLDLFYLGWYIRVARTATTRLIAPDRHVRPTHLSSLGHGRWLSGTEKWLPVSAWYFCKPLIVFLPQFGSANEMYGSEHVQNVFLFTSKQLLSNQSLPPQNLSLLREHNMYNIQAAVSPVTPLSQKKKMSGEEARLMPPPNAKTAKGWRAYVGQCRALFSQFTIITYWSVWYGICF